MAVFNGVFPILPGKEQRGRDFAAAVMGERRKGFEALQTTSRITRETWALTSRKLSRISPLPATSTASGSLAKSRN